MTSEEWDASKKVRKKVRSQFLKLVPQNLPTIEGSYGVVGVEGP
jgi:hypothetical protein